MMKYTPETHADRVRLHVMTVFGTHAKCAAAMGVSRVYVTNLCNGKRRPTPINLERMGFAHKQEVTA